MDKKITSSSPIIKQDIEAFHYTSNQFSMPHMHMHMTFELLYIKSGSTVIKNNAKSIEVHGPCIVIHNPYTLHSSQTTTDKLYDRYVINFSNNLAAKLKPWVPHFHRIESIGFKYINLDEVGSQQMFKDFREICKLCKQNKLNRCELLLGLLLDTLTREYFSSESMQSNTENTYLTRLLQHIGNNFSNNVRIDELADSYYVSRAKLMADFKAVFGVTIKQYLQLIRVNNAKAMLLSGNSITETANACGFCDDSHFIYTFRSVTGMTPKMFSSTPYEGMLSF
jgi:AraC-like DNA-binding protein